MTRRIESNYEVMEFHECLRFYKHGLKRANDMFSRLLFCITTLYLIIMIFVAYLAMSFLFDSHENGLPPIRLFILMVSFGCIFILYFLNFLSQEVTNNLSRLKEGISLSSTFSFEEKWELVQNMNNFNGFEAYGFFTLGKPHLTSVAANFSTFIIILIQFKMAT